MRPERAFINISKRRSSLCVLFMSLVFMLLALGSSSRAQDASETEIVRGRGAILRGDQSQARKRAIASSLRQAIELTVARLLEPDASVSHLQVLKEQIYRRAPQYVRSYRVLWEYPDLPQQVYRVELEVEVAVKTVSQAISHLGLSRGDQETSVEGTRQF